MAENPEGAAPEAAGGQSTVIKGVILIVLLAAAGAFAYMAYQKQEANKAITTMPPLDPNMKVDAKIDPKTMGKAMMSGMAIQNQMNKEKKQAEEAAAAEAAPAEGSAPAEAAPAEAAPAEAAPAEGAAPEEAAPAAEAPAN